MEAPDSVHVPLKAARKVRRRYLDDLIWLKILCRLPSTKSVFRCRCVSKQWNSLISDKYFISRFIEYHREIYRTNFDVGHLLLFFGYMPMEGQQCGTGFLASFGDQCNNGGCMFPRTVHLVETSFNDLLVCSDYKTSSQHYYYIFNPFTKEHVELPIYPSSRLTSHVGFVCEPFYTRGGSQFGVKPCYRYRVVRVVDCLSQPCNIETYCSETREWSTRTCLERDDYGGNSNLVAHNGKLYWYNFREKVVVYDPFVTTGETCFHFHGLSPTQLTGRSFQLAESQGSLLLMQFATNGVSIWKLKENEHDDDHDVWCFERRVIVNHGDNTTPSFIRRVVANGDYPMVLGVHPSNEDVIFIGHSKSPHVASYNFATEEWKVVGEIQQINFDRCALFREFCVRVTLPWWPTPVH